jgi:hypothetical protein
LLALMFSTGVLLLQLLGCVLWSNWWPMLTGINVKSHGPAN